MQRGWDVATVFKRLTIKWLGADLMVLDVAAGANYKGWLR